MGKEKKEQVKLVQILFVGLLIGSIFLPSGVAFMGLFGVVVSYLVLGFFVPECFDDISRILGMYMALILLIEGGHALAALGYGIPIKGMNVNLLGISEGQGEMLSGWVELDIEKEAVDASLKLQTQMSHIAVAGSLVILVFGTLYFVLPSIGNLAAVIASIMFFKHQAPFLASDQSMMIQAGWMSPAFAWFWFIVGLIVLMLAGLYAKKKMKERLVR